ncbi:GNAT family N-acetyltransferase [Butyrivibrio sp. MC2021]|uniref:GNAT family N-acetyltransferase n=1 Tax=Butyrivibrio sp. MC2021 TaxID=1408306 RepID=UPI0009DCAC23
MKKRKSRLKSLCRQGIGSRLMTAVLKDIKEKGYQKVTIGVGSDEPQNYRLYQRFVLTCIDNRYTI